MEQKDALEYLVKLGNPDLVEVEGRQYTALNLSGIKDPMATPLTVHTLTGLVDYIKAEQDMNGIVTHVYCPSEVNLYGLLQEPWRQREHFMAVEMFEGQQFPFDRYVDHETFMVWIQSRFVQDEITAQILRVVGNITDEAVKTIQDDGVSQSAHVKTGLRPTDEKIPNPVSLRPYRTFPEIEQPASKFILRLKSGKEELPQVALFDADGGQWRLEAIQSIKAWLAEKLPELVIIA